MHHPHQLAEPIFTAFKNTITRHRQTPYGNKENIILYT